jgi:hypothetical protein
VRVFSGAWHTRQSRFSKVFALQIRARFGENPSFPDATTGNNFDPFGFENFEKEVSEKRTKITVFKLQIIHRKVAYQDNRCGSSYHCKALFAKGPPTIGKESWL